MLSPKPQWRPIALALTLGCLSAAGGETTGLYRCNTADGAIEFRQSACVGPGEQQKILVNHARSGWIPPTPRADLATQSAAPQSDARQIDPHLSSIEDRREQVHACWKARAGLDEVNRQLRYGYKASQGTKLRNKRRRYAAYLRNLCSP